MVPTLPSGASPQTLLPGLLALAEHYEHACILHTCPDTPDAYGRFSLLAGFAPGGAVVADFRALPVPLAREFWFGHLSYDLKNSLEPLLSTAQPPGFQYEASGFFQAGFGLVWRQADAEPDFFGEWPPFVAWPTAPPPARARLLAPLASNFSEADYLAAIRHLQALVAAGDLYEVNLSQCFSGQLEAGFSVAGLFAQMLAWQAVPMAAYYKRGRNVALSASPERFLQRSGAQVVTQPIKGTARRHPDAKQDLRVAAQLQLSEKERAENVMIVDLARNDLNRLCVTGSVCVPRMFEVQTFRSLHHLVSTVVGRLKPEAQFHDIVRAAFPPGSMTGAPKIRAMQRIEEFEPLGRGLYAGSIGWVGPGQDFDFNVVIRTLCIDTENAKIGFHVGGAITHDSVPSAEYAETITKAASLLSLFE